MSKERVLEEMGRQDVDVLFLGREGNARYVSGAQRLFLASERAFAPGCVVVRSTGAVHLLSNTDFGVPSGVPHSNLYPTSWNPATLTGRIAAIPGVSAATRIGVDGLTPLWERLLSGSLPNAAFVDGEAVMRAARRIKSSEEVALISAAAEVATATMQAALAADGSDIKAAAMAAMAADGVTSAAFEPVVSRDDRDQVTVAVGVLRDGWEADVTRTVPGPARPDFLLDAIARCRPGTSVVDIAADVHGVGLGYEVLAPSEVLEPGMVLSVGIDGARDTVLVTDAAPEILTARPQDVR
jgi:Xaa-Pro aminopeptidase